MGTVSSIQNDILAKLYDYSIFWNNLPRSSTCHDPNIKEIDELLDFVRGIGPDIFDEDDFAKSSKKTQQESEKRYEPSEQDAKKSAVPKKKKTPKVSPAAELAPLKGTSDRKPL
jgi:hypothetical protein